MFYIYEIKNLVNNKTYIGQHQYSANVNEDGYFGSGTILKKAIDKYGIDNFRKNILISNIETIDQCNFYEIVCICYAKIFGKAEYNIALGGGGVHLSEEIREVVLNNIKKKNLEKFGGNSPMCNKKIQEKSQETCFKHYGVKFPTQSKEILRRTTKTCLEKYGIEHFTKTPEYKEKMKQYWFSINGGSAPIYSNEVKEKMKQTNIERYGVEHYMHTKEAQDKSSMIFKQFYDDNVAVGTKDCIIFLKKDSVELKEYLSNNDCDFNTCYVFNIKTKKDKKIGAKFLDQFLLENPDWRKGNCKKKVFSELEIQEITELYKNKVSFRKICKKFNVSFYAIKEVLIENNLINETEKIEHNYELYKKLYLDKKSLNFICTKFKIGRWVLVKFLKEEGVFNE